MKGQSAVEYLTTYGWMLLVVSIAGGSVFATFQNSSQIKSTSGLANADVKLEDFGVSESGLKAEIRSASADPLRNVNVSLVDQRTGASAYASEEVNIPVGDTETVGFPQVQSSSDVSTYNVEVTYDGGSLEDLTVQGTISGRISLSGGVSESGSTDAGDGSGSDTNVQPVASFSTNVTLVETGETVGFDASNSSDPDGSINLFEWDWKNEGVYEGSGMYNSVDYESSGEYVPNLTVVDNDDATASETRTISVVQSDSALTYIDGFESGLKDWNVHASCFEQKTNRVFNGTYSGGCATNGVSKKIASRNLTGSNQISTFSFYYNEDSSSTGGGVRLKNSNGDYELGFATDNPQWKLDDGTGKTKIGDGSYGGWQKVRFKFHWDEGTYDYIVNDLTKGKTEGTRKLKEGVDISEVEIQGYSGGWSSGKFYMWFDNFTWSERTVARMESPDHMSVSSKRQFSARPSSGLLPSSYEWDFDSDGDVDATGKTVNHSYSQKGSFNPVLTVRGGNEDAERARRQVKVKEKHYNYSDSFEGGDLENWDIDYYSEGYLSLAEDYSWDGNYSVSLKKSNMPRYLGEDVLYKNGGRPAAFSYYFRETSSSSGGGLRLKNSDGNYEAGVATGNPAWHVTGAEGREKIFSREIYGDWIYVQLRFHWGDGTYSYYIENKDNGITRKGTKKLKEGKNIESVSIENFSPPWSGDNDFYMWFDDLETDMSPQPEISAPKEVLTTEKTVLNASRSATRGAEIKYEWDLDNDGDIEKTGEVVRKQFKDKGDYNISLTVTGPGNEERTVYQTLTATGRFIDTFEDGEMKDWEILQDGYGIKETPSRGNYSSGYDSGFVGSADRIIAQRTAYRKGAHPDSINWSYYETGSSSGGGIRFINSEGSYELGIASDNPEWEITDGEGTKLVKDPADQYNHWVNVNVDFHWDNSTYSYSIEDPELEVSASGTGEMRSGLNIQTISVEGYSGGWSSGGFNMWFDDIYAQRGEAEARIVADHDTDVNESVVFDGEASSTSSSQPAEYRWDFQSDGTWDAKGGVVRHKFESEGEYNVTLKITGPDGENDTQSHEIYVHRFDESFDDGSMSNWVKYHDEIRVRDDWSYSQPYSIGEEQNSLGKRRLTETEVVEGGSKISNLSYYFRETTSSSGGGLRLKNSDGNYELGIASNNPEWDISDGEGTTNIFGGSGYKDWIRVRLRFHWEDGTYSYRIENLEDLYVRQGTRELRYGKDIENISLENYGGGWKSNEDFHMWFDRIHAGTRPDAQIKANEEVQTGFNVTFNGSRSATEGETQSYEWDVDGDQRVEKTGEVIHHIYNTTGTRNISLTIEDSKGRTDIAHRSVKVSNKFEDTFEDGDIGGWNSNKDPIRIRETAYESNYSIGLSRDTIEQRLASKTVMQDGGHPSSMSWLFYETDDSNGGGIRFLNSKGKYELGVATDNPQWIVSDGDGINQVYSGDGYRRWINVSLDFNWQDNTYSYIIEDLSSGTERSGTRSMKEGWNIEKVAIEGYSSGWQGGNSFHTWFDNIQASKGSPYARFTSPQEAYVDENVVMDASHSSNGRISPQRYRWDFRSDGTWEEKGEKTRHSFSQKGEYNVTLQVEDKNGATNSVKNKITIFEPIFQESFESGNLDNWKLSDSSYGSSTEYVYQGNYSAGMKDSSAPQKLAEINTTSGVKPDELRYRYFETSNSQGGGIRIKNSNGNYELGIATDNPEWHLTDGEGRIQVYGNSNYKDWHTVKIKFNWENGTYTYYIENMETGTARQGTRDLKQGVDIKTLSIENYNQGWSASGYRMWLDNIELLKK